jgi:glycosyltransferase involved in cell wall biosynthesis
MPINDEQLRASIGAAFADGSARRSPVQVLLGSRADSMTTTCVISSYNYAQFICEAVDSALGQTVAFDEIIIVDDGSTDGTVDVLKSRYARHPSIQIVSKENQGQLSCFNEGFGRSSGDIVFFLDADDVYEPDHLEQMLDAYCYEPGFDFVYCGRRDFGRWERGPEFPHDRDFGYSVILTAFLRDWIGGATSCLSMRRATLEKILPLPFLDSWRTRADDCLVFGASLAGARKFYLARALVRYRVHEQNHHCGRSPDKFAVYRRRLAINTLFEHLERKLCVNFERLAEFHHREFCTIARPTMHQLWQYLRISLSARISLFRRVACIAEMTRHYLCTAMHPAQAAISMPSTNRDAALLPVSTSKDSAIDATPAQQRRAG